jgi:small-conductance mechanosensitive channel
MEKMLYNLIISVVILVFSYLIGLGIKLILAKWVARLARKTTWRWDDAVISTLKDPIILWCILGGIYFIKNRWIISPDWATFIDKLLIILFGISMVIAAANLATKLIGLYGDKIQQALPLTNLTQNLVKFLIIAIGALMILNALGVSITPLLTTLGIGGLAVALALQDTLSNAFAGFYITMAKHIRPGDFIKLESGEEGYVTDITWRATKVRMLPNNVVVIPNSRLAQSVITNYYQPEQELAVLVQVGVHYNSDLAHVERVTCEVAKEVLRTVPGGVPEFDPFIRYHTFDDFSINFTVILRAKEFVDNYLIKHEFIKRLHKRYAEEGIVIPYPIRAINYEQERVGQEIKGPFVT